PSLGIVGVPLARTSISSSGAHGTPAAVRAALRRYSTLHAALDADLETLSVTDHGDVPVADAGPTDHLSRVEQGLIPVAAANHDLVIVLGGDNALTRPVMRALLPLSASGLLTIDAHHDVRGFHAGATNGTPVRGLVEDGLRGDHVVEVGIGALTNSRAYRDWCEDRGVTLVGLPECRGQVGSVVRMQLDRLAQTCEHLYVDLDVDVLDSAFVPGCPGARPGGLAPWELFEAAVEAGRHPCVRVVDITEVDAAADVGGVTVDIAAQCLLSAAAGLASR
ncbi:MAG: arginase family protein, partial [Actinomycetota bacterium]|nr:arginase family protein [Actinomycetota bacterium]